MIARSDVAEALAEQNVSFIGDLPDNDRKTSMVDVFLRHLKAEGIKMVFGIPGGLLHPFFEAVEQDSELTLVVAKHECGAAFMADGYARLGRRIAVVAATSGPGATNLLTGVACAYSDGVPMLVVTGQASSHSFGKGAAQETAPEDIDIVSMFRPVTKYSAMVMSPDRISHHVRRALRLALSGRRGPVHLNVPVDFWVQPATDEWSNPVTYRPQPNLFDRTEVSRAAEALLGARRPVILAGSGASSPAASERLEKLAQVIGARVATTPRAKGIFPEDHPLSLGVFGFAGHQEARETILGSKVDLLFTVGASLNETTTFNWHPALARNRILVQLDVDIDRIGRNYPVDIALVGDAETVLLELIHHVRRGTENGLKPRSTWSELPPPIRGHEAYLAPERRTSEKVPLQPERWRVELNEALPDRAIIFSDIGGHMLFNLHHLQVRRGQRFILNLGFGSMGHGTVAPIGAALACPDCPVIAIVGDACLTMNGMEMLTALEYDVPVVWIVENNHMHGITWHGSKLVSGGRAMESVVYRRPVPVSQMARAMGMETWEVYQPGQLADAVRRAVLCKRPSLIEVMVDSSISPPLADRVKSVKGNVTNLAGFKSH